MKLPSEIEMDLLVAVAARECTGREVARRYQEETGRTISYGTIYTTFRRMKEQGWVTVREDQDEDGRLKYFRATGDGLQALRDARDYFEQAIAKLGTVKLATAL